MKPDLLYDPKGWVEELPLLLIGVTSRDEQAREYAKNRLAQMAVAADNFLKGGDA